MTDRRHFLKQLTAVGTLTLAAPHLLTGCTEEPDFFETLRRLRSQVRTSPDHLVERSASLVAGRDPAAILRFVRDDIAAVPGNITGMDVRGNGALRMRSGTRGVLRSGVGTPREKAELLADLYRQSGYDARVAVRDNPATPADMREVVLGAVRPAFGPDTPLDVPGARGRDEVNPLDGDGAIREGITDSILDVLDGQATPFSSPTAFDFGLAQVPVVEVQTDDGARIADPTTGAGLESPPDRSLRDAPRPRGTSVGIRLLASTASRPDRPLELVAGSWPADDLVGGQVFTQLLPVGDFESQPGLRARDVGVFAPVLHPPGGGPVIGDGITLAGDRIRAGDDGTSVDGRAISTAGETAGEAAGVASVEMEVDTVTWPDVRLRVRPLNGDGEVVEHLGADVFSIAEDDDQMAGVLLSNRRAPRIKILTDESLSMPRIFRFGGMEQLVGQLSSALSDTGVQVELQKTDSRMWDWLSEAAASNADLIVYVTDGKVVGDLDAVRSASIAGGPPVVLIRVGSGGGGFFSAAADILGATGRIVSAANLASARDAILQFIADRDPAPYVIRYTAPKAGAATRSVRLAVGSGVGSAVGSAPGVAVDVALDVAAANATYEAPSASTPAPGRLVGIHVEITIGNRSVTRTLAGFDPDLRTDEPTEADTAAVRNACFGMFTVAFEADAPTESIRLDDYISDLLALEPILKGSGLSIEGKMPMPARLREAFPSLPAGDRAVTFVDGVRAVLYQTTPDPEAGRVRMQMDMLPLAGYATAAADATEAFRATVSRTASLAVLEDALFATSTAGLLNGVPLTPGIASEPAEGIDPLAWRRFVNQPWMGRGDARIVAQSGAANAMWHVREGTGEVLGVLSDGSGGGMEDAQATIAEVQTILSGMNLLAQIGGATPMTLLLLNYGKLLARMFGAITISLTTLDAAQAQQELVGAVASFACSAFKGILLNGLGAGPSALYFVTLTEFASDFGPCKLVEYAVT